MTHVSIHVVCIPMVVVIVLALLLKDIGGLRLCVGKWAEGVKINNHPVTHVCIHVVCIPMIVVVVLALLLKDIGGLRLCVGKWA